MRQGDGLPRGFQLAWILALAYLLIIVYASLHPFRGWRYPPDEILHFLTAPWPRYVTLSDVLINVIAYAPFGFLLSLGLKARLSAVAAVVLATLMASGLSLAMESAQMFLPTRIASNIDLLTNSTGALLGAMAAPLSLPSSFPGRRLAALRQQWFIPGAGADVGLVVICFWLLTPMHPTAQLFGTGNLRATFELPAYAIHTPQLLMFTEAVVVLFNLLGLGTLISTVMRRTSRPHLLIAAVVAIGLAIRAITSMILFKAPGLLIWLTPGVAIGLLAGALLLYPLTRMPRPAQIAVAILCFSAAVVAINLAPDNPYQMVPPKLLARGHTHFLSFSGIIRALSDLWPFLAIAYLLIAAGAGLARSKS